MIRITAPFWGTYRALRSPLPVKWGCSFTSNIIHKMRNNVVKKNLAVLIIAALAVSGVFAREREHEKPMTAFGISPYGFFAPPQRLKTPFGISAGIGGFTSSIGISGGLLFFDATYAEFSFGVLGVYGLNTASMGLNITLLGKYPLMISEKLTIFPVLGIDSIIAASSDVDDADEDESPRDSLPIIAGPNFGVILWPSFGIGLDYAVNSKVYVRGEAVSLLWYWLTVKLAAGYKF
jgi:hypothetical protein